MYVTESLLAFCLFATSTPAAKKYLVILISLIGESSCFLVGVAAVVLHLRLLMICRLKTEPWEPFFDGIKKVLPRPSDLAFFNWETMTSTSNSSPNFQVVFCCLLTISVLIQSWSLVEVKELHPHLKIIPHVLMQVVNDNEAGLLFKNKRDR